MTYVEHWVWSPGWSWAQCWPGTRSDHGQSSWPGQCSAPSPQCPGGWWHWSWGLMWRRRLRCWGWQGARLSWSRRPLCQLCSSLCRSTWLSCLQHLQRRMVRKSIKIWDAFAKHHQSSEVDIEFVNLVHSIIWFSWENDISGVGGVGQVDKTSDVESWERTETRFKRVFITWYISGVVRWQVKVRVGVKEMRSVISTSEQLSLAAALWNINK